MTMYMVIIDPVLIYTFNFSSWRLCTWKYNCVYENWITGDSVHSHN